VDDQCGSCLRVGDRYRLACYSFSCVGPLPLIGGPTRSLQLTAAVKVRIDVRLDKVVLRALEKNPELRYQRR